MVKQERKQKFELQKIHKIFVYFMFSFKEPLSHSLKWGPEIEQKLPFVNSNGIIYVLLKAFLFCG